MSWSLHSPLSLIVKLESYILPIYLSLGVVFCCFGLLHKQTNNQIFIPQAFEANASSSGGIQTLIEWNFNQDYKTIKKWKWYIKKRKVEFWLQLSNKPNWDNDSFELCWIIQIFTAPVSSPTTATPTPPAPPARISPSPSASWFLEHIKWGLQLTTETSRVG